MYGSKRVAVRDLNPHILCALCGGYLIQATTVIECLHSFCRSCIVNFLETSKVCPICDAQIHKTRPLLNIRLDQTLQSLVYKLVPGLFQDEMRRRREFHSTLSESDLEDLTLEERGEASLEKEFKPGDDHVSLVLQLASRDRKSNEFEIRDHRYLLCPSELTVRHLKKFIRLKFQLNERHKIQMYRAREELSDDLMLQDIALIYSWNRDTPMNLCYMITESLKPRTTRHKGILDACQQLSQLNANTDSSVLQTGWSSQSDRNSVLEPGKDSGLGAGKNSVLETGKNAVLETGKNAVLNASRKSSPVGLAASSSELKIVSDVLATSVSGTSLSSTITSITHSSSKLSSIKTPSSSRVTSTSTPLITSVSNNIDPTREGHKTSHSSSAEIKAQPHISSVSEKKVSSTSGLASSVSAPSFPSKPKSQSCTKLIHSVESILSQPSKKSHDKNKESILSWTPVSPAFSFTSDSCSEEKHHKAPAPNTKQSKTERPLPERSGQTMENANNNLGSNVQILTGIKRSHSVIEAASVVTVAQTDSRKTQSIIPNDNFEVKCRQLALKDKEDTVLTYIPKFQKHRKHCSVKRSASYEGHSAAAVTETSPIGDAMEKRNWKKRKLSTLDFSCDNVNNNGNMSLKVDPRHTSQIKKVTSPDQVIRTEPTSDEKTAEKAESDTNCGTTSHQIPSSTGDNPVPQTVSYLSSVQQPEAVVRSRSKTSSANLISESNATPFSRTPVCVSGINTETLKKNNSKIALGGKNIQVQLVKIEKFSQSSEKQRFVVDSYNSYVNKKSIGYMLNKSNRDNNGQAGTLARECAITKTVEEISVDTSSSPSDVSNVTSPATYVTSPGTEDRTDGSTLPDIQTSCDNNLVMTYSGKVVPLDLSSRKKK